MNVIHAFAESRPQILRRLLVEKIPEADAEAEKWEAACRASADGSEQELAYTEAYARADELACELRKEARELIAKMTGVSWDEIEGAEL